MKEITKDSPEIKNNPEAYGLFEVYDYVIILKTIGWLQTYTIYFDNDEIICSMPRFRFASQRKLSIEEVLHLLRGTTGIEKIVGDFKE